MYKNGTLMIGSSKPIKFSMITDHPLAINCSIDELDSKRNSKIKLNGNQSQESEKLQTIHSRENDSLVTTNWDGLDPLSAEIPSDALTIDLDEKETLSFFETKKNQCYIDNDFENWSWYRLKILRKFNTDEKLSIRSSFVFQNPTMNETSIQPKINRYNRVEQTDESEDAIINEMLGLSQSEYIKQIDDMSNALKNAWNSDQRVKSLKIAIQCAKQLSSVNVLQFYPSKFVLIADILDHFGQLVYERIKQKEKNENDADETCRNWFYKISSIRELLPRFYIECSVLKIYDFLLKSDNHPNNFEPIILRLTRMIRGIGDPLVAIYCRVYLCRITIQIAPECKKIFLQNFHEIFDGLNQMTSSFIQELLLHQKLSYPSYYKLFIPALNWILNCLFYKNAIYEDILLYFVSRSSKLCDRSTSAFILSSMINRFSSRFIAQNLIKIFNLIQDLYIDSEDHTKSYPRYILIKNIGQSLLKEEDFFQKYLIDKDEVFAKFSAITKLLRSKSEYITCIEIWSEIYAKFNDVNSINNFLGDIIENLSCDYENFGSQLLNILTKIIIHGRKSSDHDAFYSMNNLMPFLDLFQRDDYKIEACKTIVTSFNRNCSKNSTESFDLVILNTMNYLCKSIHDSINSMTLEDEIRQISTLINNYIRIVSSGQDFESRLSFYIESRANFTNLDKVTSFIVNQVDLLGMDTHKLVNGHHTKKTISFVNACIAFSYITIPSIYDIVTRLQLYLSSSYVALVNGCLPQTDAFLKLSIKQLRHLPRTYENSDGKIVSNEEFLFAYTSQLLSFLVVVPDNPEHGVLYLFKGLYNALKEFEFETNSNFKILIWMNLSKYLLTCGQESYPYHIIRVDSNDSLYAQDEELIKDLSIYFDIIFNEMLDMFKKSHHQFNLKQQCNFAIESILLIFKSNKIHEMSHVVNQLWNWCCKIMKKQNFSSLSTTMIGISQRLEKVLTINHQPSESDSMS